MIITIDGPAASGKSTVARMLAESFNFYYLNTGMLYRAVTYLLMYEQGYIEEKLTAVDKQDLAKCTDEGRFFYSYCPEKGATILYDHQMITPFLKDPLIDKC